MLTKPTQHPTFSEGFITACALFICIFFFSFIAKASLMTNFHQKMETAVMEESTTKEGEFQAVVMNVKNAEGDNDNLIIVKNKKGKIVELYVNGKKIPRNEIKNYEPQIQESLAQQQEQESIGNKFTPEEEIALNNIIQELEEEKKNKINSKEKVAQKREKNIQRNIIIQKDGEEVVNSFVQKTLEISKLGMQIGSLSMELENLKRQLEREKEPSETDKAKIKKLEKEISQLEAKTEKLGEEIGRAGEAMGKWSIDLSTSIMDSVMDGFKFDFQWEDEENDTEMDEE